VLALCLLRFSIFLRANFVSAPRLQMIIATNFTVCMRWSADQQFSGHSSILQKKKSKHAVTCGVQDTQ
jgi:hypothetical protein